MSDAVDRIAEMILAARRIVVFTGAGISTESGIPDFRSPGGIWSKYDPEDYTYQRFVSSEAARKKYWRMSTEFYDALKSVRPNPAHEAVAELERMGKLDCVITQNIDGLHQLAGSSPERIIELHGTARFASCLRCKKVYEREVVQQRIAEGDHAPLCDACNGFLKPATISFGQAMPEKETSEAIRLSTACDLFIVIGSSLVVQPAASMPVLAKEKGADLVIINRDPTSVDHLADVVSRDAVGRVMPKILQKLRRS